jgi:lipoprotein-anchoring transpeptidase ErfK/SrfK
MKMPNFLGKYVNTSASALETVFSETKQDTKEETTIEETTVEETTVEETTNIDEGSTIENNETDESSDLQSQDYDSLINFKAKYPYLIKVNRAANCVTIYGIDHKGQYSVAYKTMTCSTGLVTEDTPLGTYYIYEKFEWRKMVDGSYSQYAVRFNGGIMFHSIPYYSTSKDDMEWEEYNKLGSAASLGCVRLQAECAKWIYDNCPMGTTVIVYDDVDNPGELGKNEIEKIPEDCEYKGWDPTDPDAANPWRNEENGE